MSSNSSSAVSNWKLNSEAIKRGDIKIDRLVDGGHHAHPHQLVDNIAGLNAHSFGQLSDGDCFTNPNTSFDGLGYRNFGFLHFDGRGLFLFAPFAEYDFPVIIDFFQLLFNFLLYNLTARNFFFLINENFNRSLALFLGFFKFPFNYFFRRRRNDHFTRL